jgi:hypothetical protein
MCKYLQKLVMDKLGTAPLILNVPFFSLFSSHYIILVKVFVVELNKSYKMTTWYISYVIHSYSLLEAQ